MDHTMHGHGHEHGMAGHEGHQPDPAGMDSLLDGLPERQHNQLLEMLHVPLLHAGVKEAFLLPAFTTYDDGSFALACILLAVTSCILELLRLAVWWLEGRYLSEGTAGSTNTCTCKQCTYPVLSGLGGERKNYNTMHNVNEVDQVSEPVSLPTPRHNSRLYRWTTLTGVGVLTMLTYQGATMLMLVAMTMNIYLIVSLGVGASIGKVISLSMKRRIKEGRK